MPRKKAPNKSIRNEKHEVVFSNETKDAIQKNGFGDAIGYSNPFGLPGTPNGAGSPEQVSDTTTLFTNLRWYLVSNFRQLLSELFVEIGLIKTICEVPVNDALRGGVSIMSQQLDEGQIKDLQNNMDRDNDLGTAKQAGIWTRLFGGAGIIILVDDQDPATELDIASIGPDTNLQYRAVDMWELFWDKQNTEGYDPEIQTEEFEFYDYYASKVHKSRILRLKGPEAPSFIRPRLRGWGFSVVEVLVRSINQYLKATDLTFEVLDEFKVDVYKLKNLVSTLLSPNGTTAVKERVQMANWQKNYQNAVVMDSEDDWDHKQLSFAGLAEAQAGIRKQVCSDLRMPATKLFGSSESTGLGNADQNDMENYNSMVEGEVRDTLKYHIMRMIEIKCQKLFGFIPDDLEIEFKPLRILSAEQEENVKTQKFTRLLQAKQAGELTTQEFRDACNKGSLFDVKLDTSEDALNPDDPEVSDVLSGENKEESEPGTDREDARSPRAQKEVKEKKAADVKDKQVTPNSFLNKMRTLFNGSAKFEKVSFEADGGDHQFDPREKELYSNPLNVDKGLWSRAKEMSRTIYGSERWQFTVWYYKKYGGKF